MADIRKGRWTAEIEGDFVVFLIGARVNRPLSVFKSLRDLGGRRGMKYMLDYLTEHPEKGLLGYDMSFPTIVQYWRSFEHLEAFAKDEDDPHLDAWRKFWRGAAKDARTGIWHETFLVRAGEYEAMYGNMPPKGLGKAGNLVRMAESSTARSRIKSATSDTVSGTSAATDDAEPARTATLRLTSSGCSYDGPRHVPAGSRVETRLVNGTDADAGFVLVRIPEESTYDDLAEYVRLQTETIANGERSAPPPSDVAVVSVDLPQLPAREEQVTNFSFPSGEYAFVCLEQTPQMPRRDLAIHITELIVAHRA